MQISGCGGGNDVWGATPTAAATVVSDPSGRLARVLFEAYRAGRTPGSVMRSANLNAVPFENKKCGALRL